MTLAKRSSFVIVLLLMLLGVFAAQPEILSFRIETTVLNQTQLSWEIQDDDGLARVELYRDSDVLYARKTTGLHEINLYQTSDDGKPHTFKIIVYDIHNLTATAIKQKGINVTPPVVVIPATIISNKKTLNFNTNKKALCKVGLSDSALKPIETKYGTNHTTELQLKEGSMKIYIKCVDEEDNEMPKSVVATYIYDITSPGKVSGLTAGVENGQATLTWSAANDGNGIDHYNIYNTLKLIATSASTSWKVNTNDSFFSVSAIDKAGNEGAKEEYNVGRAVLLASNFTVQNTTQNVVSQLPPTNNQTIAPKTKLSTTSKVAWSIFALLCLVFIGWKAYERKADRHGLIRYMRKRRKMRDITPPFR